MGIRVRGGAQLGAIKALEEYGIFPTHISGTSIGAVIGTFYAAGYIWEEMMIFFVRPIFIFLQSIEKGISHVY